jgi:hypothetical protein
LTTSLQPGPQLRAYSFRRCSPFLLAVGFLFCLRGSSTVTAGSVIGFEFGDDFLFVNESAEVVGNAVCGFICNSGKSPNVQLSQTAIYSIRFHLEDRHEVPSELPEIVAIVTKFAGKYVSDAFVQDVVRLLADHHGVARWIKDDITRARASVYWFISIRPDQHCRKAGYGDNLQVLKNSKKVCFSDDGIQRLEQPVYSRV